MLAPLALAGLLGASALPQEPPPLPKVTHTTVSPFEPTAPLPTRGGTAASLAEFSLGQKLFHDPLLSQRRDLSCASCHVPARGFAEPRAHALDDPRLRNTPTLYNRAFGATFSWDGKAASLEQQVLMPIENPLEMALPLDDAVARLCADADQTSAFRAVYGAAPSRELLARALTAFVGSITLADSPVDRFFAAQPNSLTREEKAGLWIYESKGRCWRCHVQPNFSDELFHNTGVGAVDGRSVDPGRMAVTGAESDRGAFKTPTLRGLAFTAPYMHDGSLATLEDVVAFYRRGGNPNPNRSAKLEPLDLSDDDAQNLVAFLRALSRVETAPLPDGQRR